MEERCPSNRLLTSAILNTRQYTLASPLVLSQDQALTWYYSQDTSLQKVIQQLGNRTFANNKYHWDGNVLKRKRKLVVGNDEQLRAIIMQHYHADAVRRYSVMTIIAHKVGNKSDLAANPRLLQPLPVPNRTWSEIFMDFIVGLLSRKVLENVDRSFQARENAIEMLKFYIKRAQDRMKKYADLSRSEGEFELKLGKGNSFKMRLLPHCGKDGLLSVEPKRTLDRRISKLNNKASIYVLVKWVNHDEEDATWELVEDLIKRFLGFECIVEDVWKVWQRSGGGLSFLFEWASKEAASKSLLANNLWMQQWFDNISLWNPNSPPLGRLSWLIIEGLPVIGISISLVKAVVKDYGKILEVGRLDFDSRVLVPVKCLVLMPSMNEMRQSLKVSLNGKEYPIYIYEEQFSASCLLAHLVTNKLTISRVPCSENMENDNGEHNVDPINFGQEGNPPNEELLSEDDVVLVQELDDLLFSFQLLSDKAANMKPLTAKK
ncbi:reverse transcriptase [Tanacetum coccineum]|uniref:Reverse transcriptase n=1 Tax=Tanacetum coccineum TaxID=301880 RepID=A0ABQ5I969_9ASTR